METPIKFTIDKKINGRAGRAGYVRTPHGMFGTPAFVVVGTKATVKAILPSQLNAIGAEIILANTYHLHLRPGDKIVKEFGGLQSFMGFGGSIPMMTDSGGFQVYSLGSAFSHDFNKFISRGQLSEFTAGNAPKEKINEPLARITEDGVSFKSHIDGAKMFITPEKSINIQHNLGADIIFAFDECTSPTDSDDYQKKAMERTHRWAKRCIDEHRSNVKASSTQALFGIVQGGFNKDLRIKSAKIITEMGFDGYGIGGSYTKEDMEDVIQWVIPHLDDTKPKHLLGIGEPGQLFMGIEHGVDTFDCVAPTREARNGAMYTLDGRINLRNARFIHDHAPIDPGCQCYTCKNFTRGYMSHLIRSSELNALTLGTIHNLYFMVNLVKAIRTSILDGEFFNFRDSFLTRYYRSK